MCGLGRAITFWAIFDTLNYDPMVYVPISTFLLFYFVYIAVWNYINARRNMYIMCKFYFKSYIVSDKSMYIIYIKIVLHCIFKHLQQHMSLRTNFIGLIIYWINIYNFHANFNNFFFFFFFGAKFYQLQQHTNLKYNFHTT